MPPISNFRIFIWLSVRLNILVMKPKSAFRHLALLSATLFLLTIVLFAQVTMTSVGYAAPAGSGLNGANYAGDDA
jgi:hypothetical protein